MNTSDPTASDQAPTPEPHRFSRRKTIVFSAIATVIGLLIIEGICAVVWLTVKPKRYKGNLRVGRQFDMKNLPDITEPDPALFWQLKANATAPLDRGRMIGFIANSDHMRNREVPVPRGPNDLRILCLGDSNTFGWDVRAEQVYTALLEKQLASRLPGRDVYVLNGGCPGYTIYQGWEVLRRRGLKYKPDIVTVWFGWNDNARWDEMTDEEHASLFRTRHWLGFSATYRLLSYTIEQLRLKRVVSERAGGNVPRMPIPLFERRLRDVVNLARGAAEGTYAGARVVLIPGMYKWQVEEARKKNGKYTRYDHQKSMWRMAKERRLPLLDLVPVFAETKKSGPLFVDKGHPSVVGHQIVTDALEALLVREGLVPAAASRPRS